MASYLETRIGLGCVRLVRGSNHSFPTISLSSYTRHAAEGNPDAEKIGAFGVGPLYLVLVSRCDTYAIGHQASTACFQ